MKSFFLADRAAFREIGGGPFVVNRRLGIGLTAAHADLTGRGRSAIAMPWLLGDKDASAIEADRTLSKDNTMTIPFQAGCPAMPRRTVIAQTNAAGDNIHLIDPASNRVVGEIGEGRTVGYAVTCVYGLPDPTYNRLSFMDVIDAVEASPQPVVLVLQRDHHPLAGLDVKHDDFALKGPTAAAGVSLKPTTWPAELIPRASL